MPTYNEEINRLSVAVDEIKAKVKTVAETNEIVIDEGVDTAITILDKINQKLQQGGSNEYIIN